MIILYNIILKNYLIFNLQTTGHDYECHTVANQEFFKNCFNYFVCVEKFTKFAQ